jgi:thiol-disulfide isomerase/thioredoxin
MARLSIACALVLMFLQPLAAEPSREGDELLGRTAHEWHVEHWLNSAPLSLASLRGKVVLVRWWTAPDCPFCAATAPSLNDFDHNYRARGLRVVGFYHHKSDEPLHVDDVAHYAKLFHFEFPIAIDPQWTTLRDWWLGHGRRKFTSVSFLIDRRGVIRHIHPGGQYVKGDAGYAKLEQMIQTLLAEPS